MTDIAFIANAMREGYRDRKDGVPLYSDREGKSVYRILLHGLRWVRVRTGHYAAADGPERTWRVERAQTRGWIGWLEGFGVSPLEMEDAPVHETMREARTYCENRARRMRWVEGAPW